MPINPIAEEIAAERSAALAQASANAVLLFRGWELLVVVGLVVYWLYCRRCRAKRLAAYNALRAEWKRYEQQSN